MCSNIDVTYVATTSNRSSRTPIAIGTLKKVKNSLKAEVILVGTNLAEDLHSVLLAGHDEGRE